MSLIRPVAAGALALALLAPSAAFAQTEDPVEVLADEAALAIDAPQVDDPIGAVIPDPITVANPDGDDEILVAPSDSITADNPVGDDVIDAAADEARRLPPGR